MRYTFLIGMILLLAILPLASSYCYIETASYFQICQLNTNCTIGFTVSNETGIFDGNTFVIVNDEVGDTVFSQNISSTEGYFSVALNETNLDSTGTYFIYVMPQDECLTNTQIESFEVTTNGREAASGIVIVVFSIIFILIFAFGLYYFIKSLSNVLNLEMDILDCTIMIATYLSMWMFYYISREYLGNLFINSILEIAIDVGAVTHVFLPIVGFLISFILTNLKFQQKAKITY